MRSEAIRASLVDGQGRRASAEILDLTVTEDGVNMRLGFPPGEEVVLPVGRAVDITLESALLGTARTYAAQIQRRHEVDDCQVYEATLDAALGFELELTVLPRGAVRVRPKAGEQAEVSLVQPGVPRNVRYPLLDASHSGLSLRLPCSVERAVYKAQSLNLRLHLPGQVQACGLVGQVRTRVLAADGKGIEYGIELDSDQADGGAALAAWVERRYAELISGMRALHRSA